jgi:pimeloyl-ACP methyl ester carboxylesterase
LIPTAAQFRALYPNIDCQVRILHGAEDQIIEPKQARDLHQALRQSDLRLIQNAGHMVIYADTAAIATAVSLVADRATSISLVG